jgi:hypothetical protein
LIPHIRIGRTIRFSEDQIRDWIKAGGSPLVEDHENGQEGGSHANQD